MTFKTGILDISNEVNLPFSISFSKVKPLIITNKYMEIY